MIKKLIEEEFKAAIAGSKKKAYLKEKLETIRIRENFEYSPDAEKVRERISYPKNQLIERIRDPRHVLTFEEGATAMAYILRGSNRRIFDKTKDSVSKSTATSIALQTLEALTSRETRDQLDSQAIAGIVEMAFDDVHYRISSDKPVLDTCGMGGDRGFSFNGRRIKTANISTLTALILASTGHLVLKHGSYGNTSESGSTDAIKALTNGHYYAGSVAGIYETLRRTGFYYSDAFEVKTIHDLSHLIQGETLNHLLGPMTTPVSSGTQVHRMFGVNHQVHPSKIAKAYQLLNGYSVQKVGNCIVISGTDAQITPEEATKYTKIKNHMILDELSTQSSILAIVRNGVYIGTTTIEPAEVGLKISTPDILIDGDKNAIHQKNLAVLNGEGNGLKEYVLYNAALAYFAVAFLDRPDSVKIKQADREGIMTSGRLNPDYLRQSYEICKRVLEGGKVHQLLLSYTASIQRARAKNE